MTKKDYIAAAKVVAKITSASERYMVADAFAKLFAQDNPHFIRDKFMAACGATESQERG